MNDVARPGRRLGRSASGTFVLKLLEAGAAFAITFALARLLGAEEFGRYSVVIAWVALLTVPGMAGMENLTVRHVAGFSSSHDWGHLRGFLTFSITVVAAASLLLALAAALGAWILDVGPEQLPIFLVGMGIVPLYALTRVGQAAIRGLFRIVVGFVPELVVTPIIVIGLMVLTIALLDIVPTASWAIVIQLVAGAAALLVTIFVLWKVLPTEIRSATPAYRRREWIKSALPLLLIGGTQMVIRQTDIILIGLFKGPTDAGLYAVATRGAQLISFLLYGVNAALAPDIARLVAQGELAELQRIVTRSTRLVVAFSIPIAAVFVLFGAQFLGLFGPEYEAAAPVLAILSVAQLVNAASGSVGNLLTMSGHERDAARGFVFAAVLNLALNGLLIPAYGIVGAAVASAISLISWNLILAALVYRRLGIYSTVLGQIRMTERK